VAARVPLALGGSGLVRDAVPAEAVRWPQMPQAFRRAILQRAFDVVGTPLPQTLWQMVIASGTPLMAVEGDERNIKITSALDLELAHLIAADGVSR
jgi:2-C-methyl-D-erythritol 4-phosphate cytidylyltransferase